MSHHKDNHSHGSDAAMAPEEAAILRRGLQALLDLSRGLDYRPLPSEKYPFPLACAAYHAVPPAQTVRADVEAGMRSDPVSVLDPALALLELCECNQSDIAAHFLEDMPFISTCFNSKRCNGWIAAVGDGDRAELEKAVNSRWQFKFFSGPPRPTSIYILLSMLARYAFVYGRIESGDLHALGHFVEDYCPGLIVCRGNMTDMELTLSLAAMKMGIPAIVPTTYPFGLGRSIRADSMGDIVEAVVGFPNIRRLLSVPEIPQLPAYCDPENARQEVIPDVTWGYTPESFFIVRKGVVEAPGFRVMGQPGRDLGVTVTINAEPMDAFDRAYIERAIVAKLRTVRGVDARLDKDGFGILQAKNTNLDPSNVGEVLLAAIGNLFPKLTGKASVEIQFDPERLRAIAPLVREEMEARKTEMETASEEDIPWFLGCTGCSPFAPDHVCIVTPQRPPICGKPLGMLKTGALYSYDDMTNIHHSRLQAGVNSYVVLDKGRCLDPLRGEWSGVNAHASMMTHGRTTRIFLHSLDDCPHTGCGCFQLILFRTDKPSKGIGIMERGYAGRCPDGRGWKDLHYQLAGKQTPGMTGAVGAYLKSPKFLQAHGGWASIVWVSPKIAEMMGSLLPAGVSVG